jgi:hypothetical protein
VRVDLVGVVPVVELRGDDHLVERSEAPADVGVDEEAGDQLDRGERTGQRGVEPGGEEEHERRGDDRAVERVVAQPADPVHRRARVVDGVEPPQRRHLVRPSVHPVHEHVEEHDREEGGDDRRE